MEEFDRSIHLNRLDRKRYQQLVLEWSQRVREQPLNINEACLAHINSRRYSVFVSFVEIYNNYIYDLLEQLPQQHSSTISGHFRRTPHILRHDARHTVYVCGANEIEAKDADQAMRLFLFGLQNRQTAATLLNHCSSRSHSVFTFKLVSYEDKKFVRGQLDLSQLQMNQLSIVDLAGIERTNRTKAVGLKLAEASNINNSLLTLRNCFEALKYNQQQMANSKPIKTIPYRQHKLTFLLKSFFELGRAQIRMIVCVRPSEEDLDDNVQVLSFGKKAQELIIEPKPNSITQVNQYNQFHEEQLSEEIIASTEFKNNEIDLVEFTLTRFKWDNFKNVNLFTKESTCFHSNFIYEMNQYLQTYAIEFDKIVQAFQKLIQLLNLSLKSFPEKQATRISIILPVYNLTLSDHFSRKILPLYKITTKERQSSCLFGVTSIAGTPLVSARKNSNAGLHQQHKYSIKCIVIQELIRDLSIWESDSIDIGARFTGQLISLTQYITRLFSSQTTKASRQAEIDVFTRLYQQTPARYKVQSNKKLVTTATIQPTMAANIKSINTSKVSMLKRLFSVEQSVTISKINTENSAPRRLNISPKIKALTSQLNSLDPEFAVKMNNSIKWTNSIKCKCNSSLGGSNYNRKHVQLVKRQLFQ